MEKKNAGKKSFDALMAGMSYIIPIMVAGGILMAVGIAMVAPENIADFETGVAKTIYSWGDTIFYSMSIILAIFIANAIGDKPAVTAGFAAGLMANNGSSGVLGAIVGGLAAGWIALLLKNYIKLPKSMKSILPILIIPLLSTIGICLLMLIIEPVMGWIMNLILGLLAYLETTAPWLLGGAIGGIMSANMGGPFGGGPFVFCMTAASVGNWRPFTSMLLASMASLWGIAFAIVIAKQKFTKSERDSLPGLITGGLFLITEFCIPYAVRDPKRVFPACFLGGFVGGGLSMLLGVEIPAAHGGMVVVPLANKPFVALLCLVAQALVTCAYLLITKKNLPPEESGIELNSNVARA